MNHTLQYEVQGELESEDEEEAGVREGTRTLNPNATRNNGGPTGIDYHWKGTKGHRVSQACEIGSIAICHPSILSLDLWLADARLSIPKAHWNFKPFQSTCQVSESQVS